MHGAMSTDSAPPPSSPVKPGVFLAIIGLIVLAVVAAFVFLPETEQVDDRMVLQSLPQGIMGTDTTLLVVVRKQDEAAGKNALAQAEQALRSAEAILSTWIDSSEMGRLNAAEVGEEIVLGKASRFVLEAANEAYDVSGGAFDVTCRPLVELWRQAGEEDALPSEAELSAVRALCGWAGFELTETGIIKRLEGARMDLGAIAKGFAIDQAMARMASSDAILAGMVDVGGDLGAFDRQPEGKGWSVDIRHPFTPEGLGTLSVVNAAVCTSGNYARFSMIGGQQFSHIIDPRTGMPADSIPSVTVVAPSTMDADIWATILSVLGREGLPLLPEGVEALLVLGDDPANLRLMATNGFAAYFEQKPVLPLSYAVE